MYRCNYIIDYVYDPFNENWRELLKIKTCYFSIIHQPILRGSCLQQPPKTEVSYIMITAILLLDKFLPADRKPRPRNWGFCHGEVFGGVGWVGDSNVPCTCTHFWCYATGCFSLTCTHVGCYVIDFPWSRTHVRCYASDGVGWGQ